MIFFITQVTTSTQTRSSVPGCASNSCHAFSGNQGILHRTAHAFTLIELAVIILVLILIVIAFIPGLQNGKRLSQRKDCVKNLKWVGLAYRTWSLDSSDSYPENVEVKYGGSKEYLAAGQLDLHYRTLSNDLSTPKVLACPADFQKTVATSFNATFSSNNISYFASMNASESYPQTILSGDRNLALAGRSLAPGSVTLVTNPPTPLLWTKTIHPFCGNVGLADGSVQMFDDKQLTNAIHHQEIPTNRLVLP